MVTVKKCILGEEGIEGTTTFNICYEEKTALIWIKILGVLNVDIWKKIAVDVIKAKLDYGYKKTIYDVTGAIVKESTFGIFEVAANLDDFGFRRNIKTAFVYSNNTVDMKFFETVAYNRGFVVKIFTNTLEAVTWLKGN